MAKLSLNDLKLILQEVQSAGNKWYDIGLQLDLSVDFLEDLDSKLSKKKIDVTTCLRKVLVEWLKSNQASWLLLIRALRSDLVKGKKLANALQRKYGVPSLGKLLC